ncbi:hypothetical protein T08_640 [Trichinella sp. T8]|nr:hypothetical protein T08_640 [Trichinella sp. T8]
MPKVLFYLSDIALMKATKTGSGGLLNVSIEILF